MLVIIFVIIVCLIVLILLLNNNKINDPKNYVLKKCQYVINSNQPTVLDIQAIAEEIDITDTLIPNVSIWCNGDKIVKFIGMSHIGTLNFYENVRCLVAQNVIDGYVLFYEKVDLDILCDEDKRKVRRFIGIYPSEKVYDTISALSDDIESQREDMFTGFGDYDFIVDISPYEFVQGLKNAAGGDIILNEEDYETPLDQAIEKYPNVDQEAFDREILSDRNLIIAQAVQRSNYDKIIMIYGDKHRQGIFDNLKRLDSRWKVVESGFDC